MLNIEVNEETVKSMLEKAIQERVEELAKMQYFMTYSQLATYLNISKPIIEERLIKNGLKYYKVGTKYLFRREEVDAFLDDICASMTATNNDIKFFSGLNNGKG